MNLVIVGSVLARSEDTKPIIREVIERLKPQQLGSGGAQGVDSHVKEVYDTYEWNMNFREFLPETKSWNGFHGYKWRNMKMVKWGDYFIRIASKRSTTYGSGWTVTRAKERGKPVEIYVVD